MMEPDYKLKKPGDMVELCQVSYPQYRGMLGILTHRDHPTRDAGRGVGAAEMWRVLINGRVHPYVIDDADMSVIA